jgi:bacillolysin
MKKLLSIIVICVFLLSMVVQAAGADPKTMKDPDIDKKLKKVEILEKLQELSLKKDTEFKINWNEEKGIPDFITGNLSETPVQDEADAIAFLENTKDIFGVQNGSFKIEKTNKDELNTKHYRAQMTVDEIPVYGAELIIHTNPEGGVYSINGQAEPDIPAKAWKKMIEINEKEAIAAAESYLGIELKKENYSHEPSADIYLYQANSEWQPVYLTTLQFIDPYPANWKIFVNAESGKVVDSFNSAAGTASVGTGTGVHGETRSLNTDYTGGTYYLRDLTKSAQITTYDLNHSTSGNGTLMADTDNNFNSTVQRAGVDAHYFAGIVYDYYKNKFNRNSYNGNGAEIISRVHYGTNYNNAGWTGYEMIYGDGDGTTFGPFSGALDVIAHELTHAVTENEANLEYQDQPGALNESFSDIFGYLAEGDTDDWQMGEDCYTPNTPGDALRDLQNPTLYDQPAHMDDYLYTSEDYGGVHTNSGIPNKAFYNITTAINNNSKVENIYYRALTTYLTTTSQFTDARTALEQSAKDLYGTSSTEAQAVANGFTAVGIGSSSSQDNYEPNDTMGAAYGALTSATNYNSYISTSSDIDYYYFDTTAAGTITVTLTNVPKDYDLYLYNSSGTQLGRSINGSTTNENISYSASNAGKFYVKVIGYNGVNSTSPYTLNATYPTGGGGSYQWYYETTSMDSPHNYTNNYNGSQNYTKTGAQKVSVHFSRFETESGYDFVYIKDKNGNTIATYDGTKSAFWATVDGDKITINLVTDYSVTAYGYHIDQVGYYSSTPLVVGESAANDNILSTDELLAPEDLPKK